MMTPSIQARHRSIRSGDKMRMITVYSHKDTLRQKELLNQYGAIMEAHTHPSVYSYQKGKSCNTAVREVQSRIPHYRFYIKADIKAFFPSIRKELAASVLQNLIGVQGTAEILRYVFWDGKGAAEGSPLSPLLSNLCLYEFDRRMSSRSGQFYLRYSDDLLILTNAPVPSILAFIEQQLKDLGLSLNSGKTQSGKAAGGIPFLGKIIHPNRILPAPSRISQSLQRICPERNPERQAKMLQGVLNYFKQCATASARPASKASRTEWKRRK